MTTRLAVALNDLAESFDRAIRKATTPRLARALCNLRAETEDKLHRAADGYGRRSPAEVIAEVLDRIGDLLGGSEVMALAKRASGEAERKPEGEELVAALIAVAKEFKELATSARRAMKKLGAEDAFDRWEKGFHKRLSDALHRQDLQTAQIVMSKARTALSALLDDAQIAQAMGETEKSFIPGLSNFQ